MQMIVGRRRKNGIELIFRVGMNSPRLPRDFLFFLRYFAQILKCEDAFFFICKRLGVLEKCFTRVINLLFLVVSKALRVLSENMTLIQLKTYSAEKKCWKQVFEKHFYWKNICSYVKKLK